MKLWALGSGSRGNAVLVESGGCRLLIDAGFGPRVLQRRLQTAGIAPESIEACIITHEHADHVRGAVKAARRWRWPVYASEGTVLGSRLAELGAQTHTFRAGATLTFSDVAVATFRTPHDAREPIGVVATARSTGASAAICTDIGHASATVRQMVRDVDILFLESNHCEDMLAHGPYPFFLQRRIASSVGHLSNRACAALVRDAVTPRLRQVVLAHLSEENNAPRVAFDVMHSALRATRFRGTIVPALQDGVIGPFTAGAPREREQLSLGL